MKLVRPLARGKWRAAVGASCSLVLLASGCVSTLPTEARPCPCVAPEVCCAALAVCRPAWQSCPSDEGGAVAHEAEAVCSDDHVAHADVIDDMEHGTAALSGYPEGGVWFLTNDGTAGAWQEPAAAALAPAEIAGGRCASRMALHTWGEGFLGWGAEAGLVLRVDSGTSSESVSLPIDASDYLGLRFFARVRSGTNSALMVTVGDVNTVPAGGVCSDATDSAERQCYNMYATTLAIGSEWAAYRVLFSELRQAPDWGYRTSALDRSQVFGLNFEFQLSTQAFDLWIDDLAWIRQP